MRKKCEACGCRRSRAYSCAACGKVLCGCCSFPSRHTGKRICCHPGGTTEECRAKMRAEWAAGRGERPAATDDD